jgi:hypothetical protein
MTYRYSGVRLFAHPWVACTPSEQQPQSNAVEGTEQVERRNGEGEESKEEPMQLDAPVDANGETSASKSSSIVHPPEIVYPFQLLHALNSHMQSVTASALSSLYSSPTDPPLARSSAGSRFNLTLLNYLDPRTHSLPLRKEPYYQMGDLAVGWHRDESLEELSSIAVYHSSEETDTSKQELDASQFWHIALKRAWDVETPAVKVALKDGDAYVMAYDLNTTHQHAVLAGTGKRFSSTHRVAVQEGNRLEDIQKKVKEVNALFPDSSPLLPSSLPLSSLSLLLSLSFTLEFEWLRQFHLHGRRHARNHAYYWTCEIERLEREWRRVQEKVEWVYRTLGEYGFSSRDDPAAPPALDLEVCRALLQSFEQTMRAREQWSARYQQPAYYPTKQQRGDDAASSTHAIDPHEDEPIDRPAFDDASTMPWDLTEHVRCLREWEAEFQRYAEQAKE